MSDALGVQPTAEDALSFAWMKTTRVFDDNKQAFLQRKRRALNEGGTSSSKTMSIMQLLIAIARGATKSMLISVVSESFPHLRRGAIRDFQVIMGERYDPERWNATEHSYVFGKGKIEFFSADVPAKMRGGRRDILFINEANNVAYDSFRELDIRTRLFTFLDWNPVSEFWVHENGLIGKDENAYIHSTYLDAIEVLPPEVVVNIESNKGSDPNWWNVYGLGLIGKIEGLVYPKFDQIDQMPVLIHGAKEFYGLDFGYSTDPTGLVRNILIGQDLSSDELIYEKGLTNDMLAKRMADLGVRKNYDEIWADAADPKTIDELRKYGFNVKPAPKGPGSVEYGHQKVLQFKHHWTKRSLNAIKEQRNFRYIADKDGRLTEKTTHVFSHLMDARRYGCAGLFEQENLSGFVAGTKKANFPK
ncbi:MAG: hypothetical protein PHQ43_00100 [Dehalococcoidales bacterium]|nr:hypothetical protein [Dehalococcoidales bacterium]